jgi:hypothetical protein
MEKIIICPHCDDFILIEELNCAIFRHAIMIDTGQQIDSHLPKKECEQLLKESKIYGCSNPFKITILKDGTWNIEKCDFI